MAVKSPEQQQQKEPEKKEEDCPAPVEQATETPASDSSLNETKPPADEVAEWDCNTSIESIELRLTPEPSADSESGKCHKYFL